MNLRIGNLKSFAASVASLMDRDVANETWVMLAPYGRWPNASVGMQVFNEKDAANICKEFDSTIAAPEKVLGLPWYVGHPDHDAFAGKAGHGDKSAKGRIKGMQARGDGLWARVKWNDDGSKLIANEAYHGHSVNWRMRRVDGEWHPIFVRSVGFTNDPQIPVPTITVANERSSECEFMNFFGGNSDRSVAVSAHRNRK